MWYLGGVRRALPALLCLLTLGASYSAVPAPRAAAYEGQATLGVEAGYGVVAITDTDLPQHGALVGLEFGIGLGDQFALRAHADYAIHPGDDPMHVGLFGIEALYLIDIVRVVPYFGLGIDGILTGYQGSAGLELGFHVTVGAEYLLNRSWLIGLDIRPHFLPITLAEGRVEPVYIATTLRVSWLFDL
ncbi:MAG: hypothetical protein DRJ42_20080 [Deltaproteobacteria bacterium]|nr:MAG: hypothetical protein DRJ42_20080 [Deltaproteobacteria bacterium]